MNAEGGRQRYIPASAPSVHDAFAAFCLSLGYDIGGLPEDSGRVVRFPVQGDKAGSKSGYYFFHADAPANGEVGHWKREQQEKHRWHGRCHLHKPPAPEIAAKRKEREDRRREERDKAAVKARHRWCDGAKVHEHPYLTKKGIGAHGARLWRERLIIPVYSHEGRITSAQYIFGDGAKRFHPGGVIGGGVYLIGPKPFTASERAFIAEGFATAATVHEATGDPVFVAFDASNMVRSARWLAEKYRRPIDIAGDDDAHLDRNVGRNAAMSAAATTGGRAFFPAMQGHPGTDFNDQHAQLGLASVAGVLANA